MLNEISTMNILLPQLTERTTMTMQPPQHTGPSPTPAPTYPSNGRYRIYQNPYGPLIYPSPRRLGNNHHTPKYEHWKDSKLHLYQSTYCSPRPKLDPRNPPPTPPPQIAPHNKPLSYAPVYLDPSRLPTHAPPGPLHGPRTPPQTQTTPNTNPRYRSTLRQPPPVSNKWQHNKTGRQCITQVLAHPLTTRDTCLPDLRHPHTSPSQYRRCANHNIRAIHDAHLRLLCPLYTPHRKPNCNPTRKPHYTTLATQGANSPPPPHINNTQPPPCTHMFQPSYPNHYAIPALPLPSHPSPNPLPCTPYKLPASQVPPALHHPISRPVHDYMPPLSHPHESSTKTTLTNHPSTNTLRPHSPLLETNYVYLP